MKKKISQREKQAKLRRKCDRVAQEIFMSDPENRICEVCGGPASCGHHYVPKGVSAALRYEFKNFVPICIDCHAAHHMQGDPHIHNVIEQKRGQEWVDWTEIHRRDEVKISLLYYQKILEKFYSVLSTD